MVGATFPPNRNTVVSVGLGVCCTGPARTQFTPRIRNFGYNLPVMRLLLLIAFLTLIQASQPVQQHEARENVQATAGADRSVTVSKLPTVTVAAPKRLGRLGLLGFQSVSGDRRHSASLVAVVDTRRCSTSSPRDEKAARFHASPVEGHERAG